jgi:hypothetical protein
MEMVAPEQMDLSRRVAPVETHQFAIVLRTVMGDTVLT